MTNAKIITPSSLKTALAHRSEVVLVGGCFDIFHYGHLQFLRDSRAQGTTLVVLLESDEFIRSRKGHEPYHTQQQRAELLAELECVDRVVLLPFFETDVQYADIVKIIHPAVISITEGDSHLVQKQNYAAEVGAIVYTVPLLAQFSTTHVKHHATISND